jgi:hypothetical protein
MEKPKLYGKTAHVTAEASEKTKLNMEYNQHINNGITST